VRKCGGVVTQVDYFVFGPIFVFVGMLFGTFAEKNFVLVITIPNPQEVETKINSYSRTTEY